MRIWTDCATNVVIFIILRKQAFFLKYLKAYSSLYNSSLYGRFVYLFRVRSYQTEVDTRITVAQPRKIYKMQGEILKGRAALYDD